MSREIEKRYELKKFPGDAKIIDVSLIEQTYTYIGETMTARIRHEVTSINKEKYSHATKYSISRDVREEVEAVINKRQYESLIEELNLVTFHKTRFFYALSDGLIATIDWFETGKIIVEVEFATEEQMNSFIPPSWMGAEITSPASYNIEVFNQLLKTRRKES